MIRLRAGKTPGWGFVPSAASDNTAPREATASHNSRFVAGYTVSRPVPTTATGAADRPASSESAGMGRAVDPTCQPRDNDDTGQGEI